MFLNSQMVIQHIMLRTKAWSKIFWLATSILFRVSKTHAGEFGDDNGGDNDDDDDDDDDNDYDDWWWWWLTREWQKSSLLPSHK